MAGIDKNILILLVFFINAVMSGIGSAEPITADLLFKPSVDSGFILSPNGKNIVFIKQHASDFALLNTKLGDASEPNEITRLPVYPKNLTWVSNKRLFYQVKGEIFVVDLDQSEHRLILHHWHGKGDRVYMNWRILNALHDDREHVLVMGEGRLAGVYKVNIYTGDKEIIFDSSKSKDIVWHINTLGNPIIGWQKYWDKVTLYLPGQDSKKPEMLDDLLVGSPFNFVKKKKTYLNNRFFYEGKDHRSENVIISHNVGADRYKLYEYNIAQKELIKELYSDQRYDVGGPILGNQLVYSGDELIGVKYLKDRYQSVWFNDDFKEVQKRLDKKYPGHSNNIISWSSDHNLFIFVSRTTNHRGLVFLFTKDKNTFEKLSNLSPWLDNFQLPHEKPFKYQSRDGLEHDAYLTLPLNFSGKAIKTIIIPVSNLYGRQSNYYTAESLYFASKGYAVLRVNHRGTMGLGSQYLLSGIENSFELAVNDIVDSVQWLVKSKIAKADNLFLVGKRTGAYLSLLAVRRYPKMFKAVSSLSSELDIKEHMNKLKGDKRLSELEFWKLAVGIKKAKEKKRVLNELSHIKNVGAFSIPVLLFYGKRNGDVSDEEAKSFLGLLNKNNIKTDLKMISGEGKQLIRRSNKVYYVQTIEDFFDGIK